MTVSTRDVPESPTASRSGPLPAAVLERVRARDPEAMGLVFDRYFDFVYGLAFRLLGSHHAAEDASQEVFLKVHRAAHRIDPTRDLAPWITKITYNACRDLWRSSASRMSRSSISLDADRVLADGLASSTSSPEEQLAEKEKAAAVQHAIARLSEPLRVAVVLHDYQGLSHEEIASATGSSHAAARKRYSRALQALSRLLGGEA